MYRAAVNENNVVICIGMDEGQSGAYNDLGTWCDFVFEAIPAISPELQVLATRSAPMLLKVENDQIVLRTVEEIQAAPNG